MEAYCIDPQARICLLRHIHAMRHELTDKPCHDCEPAMEIVDLMRRKESSKGKSRAINVIAQPVESFSIPKDPDEPCLSGGEGIVSAPEGFDPAILREALRPILNKQAKSGQKSVYLDRIQTLYNAISPKSSRVAGKRRFLDAVKTLGRFTIQGSYILLDRKAWEFCMGQVEEGL